MTPPPLPPSAQPTRNPLSLAHASLVLAVLPFIGRMLRSNAGQSVSREAATYWVLVSTALAVLALVVGIVALVRSSRPRGAAIAGTGIGLLQLAVYGLAMLAR